MDYKSAIKDMDKGNFYPIYVIFGTERYLMQEFAAHLAKCLIPPEDADFSINKYDLAETALETIIDDAETLPFLAPRKLIIASNALFLTGAKDSSKAVHNLERLLKYMQSPAEYTVILFTVYADKLDERKKLVKSLKQQGGVFAFQPLRERELSLWIKRLADKYQLTFTDGAMEKLMLYKGADLEAMSAEIEKLSLLIGQAGGIVQPEVVDKMVARSLEQNVFELIDEMVHLRLERALVILYDLLKQKEEPIKILILIARQFRIIVQSQELHQRNLSDQQIAAQIGAPPFAVRLAIAQGRKYSKKRIEAILTQLADLDYQMKSGKIDKVLALELFMLKLAS